MTLEATLIETLKSLEYWFDTDEEYLATLSDSDRADNAVQLGKIRAALAKVGGGA